MSESSDGTMSLSEFARHKGWRASYITELKRAGRLVLSDDGKRVRVRESVERIRETESPAWDGVRDRHAESRAATPQSHGQQPPPSDDHDDDDAATAASGRNSDDVIRTRRAKRISAETAAQDSVLNLRVKMGKLVDAAQVRAVAADMGTTLRRRLESLAPLVSAQVDERDRDRVHDQVRDIAEQTLADLERAFSRGMSRRDPA